LLIFTNQLNAKLISKTIFKFNTYGQVIDVYQELNSERAQILIGMEANKEELVQVVNYVQENVEKNERFFAFPWSPELYFLSDRNNATSFDTPYAFFSTKYQEQMVKEIKNNKPKIIIYDTGANFGNLTSESLSIVNEYIINNYTQVNQIHSYRIYK
jgi:cellulose biosynthesis protein BcsQ